MTSHAFPANPAAAAGIPPLAAAAPHAAVQAVPDCVVCRQATCADHRACQTELLAMLDRTASRAAVERDVRLRDVVRAAA